MNEENQNPVTPTETETPVVQEEQSITTTVNKNRTYYIGAAILAVLLILGGVVYVMEREGRLNTGIFDGVERTLLENKTIATVNDTEISEYDLRISMEQIAAAAKAQGVDTTDPDVSASIKEQAIDMLVNTELLKQEANQRGIEVDQTEVDARYEQLVAEVGGEEVLKGRMEEFGVTDSILKRDIKNELTIQKLLDQVFAETEITASEEEILELYNNAGGVEAGLPELEEVRGQIEQQIITTKEQEVVNQYVDELRAKATVDIQIEI